MRFRGSGQAMAMLAALSLAPAGSINSRASERLPSLEVPVYKVTAKGTGRRLGSLRFTETSRGLIVRAELQGLLPGRNSMHIHQFGSCEPANKNGQLEPGAGAGPHWDPSGGMEHGHEHSHAGRDTPAKELPLGDLPDLIANAEGISTSIVAATRIHSLSQIAGRSVIVHHGIDGPRFACGLLPD